MMHGNHNIATDELCCTSSISKDYVTETFEEPGCSKVCHLWMPWMLTNAQTHTHTLSAKKFPPIFCTNNTGSWGFWSKTVMGNETWVHHS